MDKETKKYVRQLASASTIGLEVALAVFIGLGFGVWLDKKFDTFPWLAIVFMILGVAAGFLNYYRFVRRMQDDQ